MPVKSVQVGKESGSPLQTDKAPLDFKIATWNNFKIAVSLRYETAKSKCSQVSHKIGDLGRHVLRRERTSHSKLLNSKHPIATREQEWSLNQALLRDIYEKTDDPEQQKQIRFLATNYLNKAAPIMVEDLGPYKSSFKGQVGPYKDYTYHRTSYWQNTALNHVGRDEFALKGKSPMILTNLDDIGEFLALNFTILDETNEEEWQQIFVSKLEAHFANSSNFNEALKTGFVPKVLIDLTKKFEDSIRTCGDKQKEADFKRQFNAFKKQLDKTLDRSVEEYCQKNPQRLKQKKKIKAALKKNTVSVSRLKIAEYAGLKMMPVFGEKWNGQANDFDRFCISRAGLFIGALDARRHIYDGLNLRNDIRYAVKSKTGVKPFPKVDDFLTTRLFTRLVKKWNKDDFAATYPPQAILGRAILRLVENLVLEVPEEKWNEVNADPIKGEILQLVLERMQGHLAHAELYIDDFGKFAQHIELAHSELATLLELVSPYKEEDFADIYKDQLHNIPEDLRAFVKPGLGKTGMSIFTGIYAAVLKQNPNPVVVTNADSYFEGRYFISANGPRHVYEAAIKDKSITSVDFYSCQTNPNIEPNMNKSRYRVSNIKGNIHKLLQEKPDTTHLTVAIDRTIDHLSSEQIEKILSEFKTEIRDGKLNFVIFGSGQKLDMFGMDNYYGAHFYTVNNGGEQWKAFDEMLHSGKEALQIDPLSRQWFCHMFKHAGDVAEDYKSAIFENTRQVLNGLPQSIKGEHKSEKQKLWISSVDTNMKPAFIDIKLKGKLGNLKAKFFVYNLYKKCREQGIVIYPRHSFGFYHLNVDIIEGAEGASIRLKPGLDPAENEKIIKILQELTDNYDSLPVANKFQSLHSDRKSLVWKKLSRAEKKVLRESLKRDKNSISGVNKQTHKLQLSIIKKIEASKKQSFASLPKKRAGFFKRGVDKIKYATSSIWKFRSHKKKKKARKSSAAKKPITVVPPPPSEPPPVPPKPLARSKATTATLTSAKAGLDTAPVALSAPPPPPKARTAKPRFTLVPLPSRRAAPNTEPVESSKNPALKEVDAYVLETLLNEKRAASPGKAIKLKELLKKNGFSTTISNGVFDSGNFFKNVSLQDITFSDCSFDWCHFVGTTLKNVCFTNCKLDNVSFRSTDLKNCAFENCDITEAMFVKSECENVRFASSSLNGCSFENATLIDSTFEDISGMRGAHFLETKVQDCQIAKSNLKDAVFFGALEKFNIDESSKLTVQVTAPVTSFLVLCETRGESNPKLYLKIGQKAGNIPIRVAAKPQFNLAKATEEVKLALENISSQEESDLPIPQKLMAEIRSNPHLYPYNMKIVNKASLLASEVDSFFLPGGVDIPPEVYGEEPQAVSKWEGDYRRAILEFGIINQAVTKGIPLMGVCRGFQITNVYFGAKMTQHINGHNKKAQEYTIDYDSDDNPDNGGLYSALNGNTVKSMAFHHQGIEEGNQAKQYLKTVVTYKGVIKATEPKNGASSPMILLQFHPEYYKANTAKTFRQEIIDITTSNKMSPLNDHFWDLLADSAKTYRHKKMVLKELQEWFKSDNSLDSFEIESDELSAEITGFEFEDLEEDDLQGSELQDEFYEEEK